MVTMIDWCRQSDRRSYYTAGTTKRGSFVTKIVTRCSDRLNGQSIVPTCGVEGEESEYIIVHNNINDNIAAGINEQLVINK